MQHTLYVVENLMEIAELTRLFEDVPVMYIADGHHRSAAAALVGAEKAKQNPNHRGDEEYNFFMAVCFPANQLTIIDYNRVVKDLKRTDGGRVPLQSGNEFYRRRKRYGYNINQRDMP